MSDDGNDMVPLSDIAPQWRSLPSLDVPRSVGIISANDDALFFMDHIDRETQVWRTDGTTDGTIPIGEASLNPVNVIATTEGVYLVVDDLENSVRSERHHLYVADSQGQSVKLVESFSQRPQVLDTQLGPFVVESTGDQRILRNSKLEMVADLGPRGLIDFVDIETESDEFFFAEIEKVPFFELGSTTITSVTLSIWRSDGTPTGTRRIARQPIAPGSDVEMALLDGMLFYSVLSPSGESQLWATDGTNEQTYVYDFPGFEPPSGLAQLGDRIVFAAGSAGYGRELWQLADPRPLRGDIDRNQQVDFADFTLFSSDFGQEGEGLVSDIDDDGDVDFADFLALSEDFGRTNPALPDATLETIEPTRVDLAIAEL